MDKKLVAWARSVKARHRHRPLPPPLWLFTDPARMPDLVATIRALPAGLCGVVFRHDGVPGRADLAARVARLCRQRRLAMVVAGHSIQLAGVGVHRRGGRGPAGPGGTASAHGRAELLRAARGGAAAVFLSPAYATASHAGAAGLGPLRWAALARHARIPVLALGGIEGGNVRRLPRWAAGVGAIGALAER